MSSFAPSYADAAKLLPYGEKARRFIARHPMYDKFINILEGAVRSGKTWAMLSKILELSDYQVAGHKILTGVSKQTIYNNVLSDLFDILGERYYTYNRMTGELNLMGWPWLVIGAKDEGSERYIRGLTVGVAVGDELSLMPVNFLKMLLSRLSPPGARLYGTTNPDSPLHYLKTDVIDNDFFRVKDAIFVEHFTLDDNPYLTEDKKELYRGMYKGLFKLRYIDGLWVMAEGSIYKDCWNDVLFYDDDSAPAGLREQSVYADRWVCCDYGTDHPQVYQDHIDDGNTIWIDREYVWDSKIEMRQKTDREYADDLEKFLAPTAGSLVIVPPEAASFKAELTQRGIWHTDADNDVTDGIKAVAIMMATRRLRVNRKNCPRLAQRILTYIWDAKASLRGLEEPLKQMDDECDCMRYGVKTKIAAWRLAA
jgi:PBSX family phage terminase large subunit